MKMQGEDGAALPQKSGSGRHWKDLKQRDPVLSAVRHEIFVDTEDSLILFSPFMGDRICRSFGAPDSPGRVVLQICRRYAAGRRRSAEGAAAKKEIMSALQVLGKLIELDPRPYGRGY